MSRVHLRNVPGTVTVEELRSLCDRLSIPGDVHLARDAASSRYAGEAYIDCPGVPEARSAASKLQGQVLAGVALEVEVVETSEFFDRDGLFADGEAQMGRQDAPPSGDVDGEND